MSTPSDAPPIYSRVDPKVAGTDPGPGHRLEARNGITPQQRRSMEDERRPLPPGWVRQFDPETSHQYFVDTEAKPHRSIWHHPYDDDEFLATLPSDERDHIEVLKRHSTIHDIVAEESDDEDSHHASSKIGGSSSSDGQLAQHPDKPDKVHQWGRKIKDKVTQTTHQQREQQRQQRDQDERDAYEKHMEFRRALQKAIETGQPQFLGKGTDGKDVFVEAPEGSGGYGSGGGYGSSGFGVSSSANATYIRPSMPYSRPYGRGYGGGYGLPITAGLGGLGGGLLLGNMMYGGMGMGGMGMGMGGMGMGMGGGGF